MDFQGVITGSEYFKELENRLMRAKTHKQLYKVVVGAPFTDKRVPALLGLGIISLLAVNPKTKTIDRLALTDNEMTRNIFKMSTRSFYDMKVPLHYTRNFIAKAIDENHYMITTDWQYLFTPAIPAEQSRFIQAGGGVACSVVYPLPNIPHGGAIVYNFYESIDRIGKDHHNFMGRYSAMVQRAFNNIKPL